MSAKTMDELAKDALQEAFSAQLLAALDGPQRDALLKKAFAESLNGWEFKSKIEDVVKNRTMKKCQEILDSGAYDVAIAEAIQVGLTKLIEQIPKAVTLAFAEVLFGKGGDAYASRAGDILRHLKLPDPK